MNGGPQKQFTMIGLTDGSTVLALGSARVCANRLEEAAREGRFHRFRQPYYKHGFGFQFVPVFVHPDQVVTLGDYRAHLRMMERLGSGEWVPVSDVLGRASNADR